MVGLPRGGVVQGLERSLLSGVNRYGDAATSGVENGDVEFAVRPGDGVSTASLGYAIADWGILNCCGDCRKLPGVCCG